MLTSVHTYVQIHIHTNMGPEPLATLYGQITDLSSLCLVGGVGGWWVGRWMSGWVGMQVHGLAGLWWRHGQAQVADGSLSDRWMYTYLCACK